MALEIKVKNSLKITFYRKKYDDDPDFRIFLGVAQVFQFKIGQRFRFGNCQQGGPKKLVILMSRDANSEW